MGPAKSKKIDLKDFSQQTLGKTHDFLNGIDQLTDEVKEDVEVIVLAMNIFIEEIKQSLEEYEFFDNLYKYYETRMNEEKKKGFKYFLGKFSRFR